MGIFSGKGPQQRCALRILVCNMTCKDSVCKMTAKEPLIVGFVVEIYLYKYGTLGVLATLQDSRVSIPCFVSKMTAKEPLIVGFVVGNDM